MQYTCISVLKRISIDIWNGTCVYCIGYSAESVNTILIIAIGLSWNEIQSGTQFLLSLLTLRVYWKCIENQNNKAEDIAVSDCYDEAKLRDCSGCGAEEVNKVVKRSANPPF